MWSHGREKLDEFVAFLYNSHVNITFTVEIEQAGSLPFLNILFLRNQNGTLRRNVYKKSTHTNLYLLNSSHHHSSQKRSVMATLVNTAVKIVDKEHLEEELVVLK